MRLILKRLYKKSTYTIGKLFINDAYFCDILEDTDRGLSSDMPLEEIKVKKVMAKTAIPRGEYKVTLDVVSPRFSKDSFYSKVCQGKLPRLLDVKGYEGVLIHAGNIAEHTEGCLLCGENKAKGQVLNSRVTFENLYKELLKDKDNIIIIIQ